MTILKKCYLILLFLFFFINFLCLEARVEQGKYISYKSINKMALGFEKSQVLAALGKPIYTLSSDLECWCYYYLLVSKKPNKGNAKRIVLVYFFNNFVVGFKVLD